jgi:hypothetical protein
MFALFLFIAQRSNLEVVSRFFLASDAICSNIEEVTFEAMEAVEVVHTARN